ncbi:hypothetical protein [Caenimonas koreensis]|uniref:Right handed beta helix region n=1 Tax=Caenimonas koreensis DSM 17982 TaxID=1121255 RepID=A0A844B6H4_9BURK|nr:hypothetical protein [Caenimonas koreensis]MRD46151.1 hypothetical protein [Caenimonas koreensis DSM 17982]
MAFGRMKALLLVAGMLLTGAASAQATRTWISGVGDDANPCSRTAPCKTFAGAISKTAVGGIINALDPAGFGAVTITKAITLDGGHVMASVLSSSTSGIIINVGTTDLVVLRNLHMDGTNSTANSAGVKILQAGMVVIEDSNIQRYEAGIDITSGATGVRVDIKNVTSTGSLFGLRAAAPNAITSLRGSSIRGNGTGISVAAGEVTMQGNSITHNTLGLIRTGGTLSSYNDNMIFGNNSSDWKPGKNPQYKFD